MDTLPVTSARRSVNALLKSENVPLVLLPGERSPVFSVYRYTCHKTQTSPTPLPSHGPGSRQRIPGITLGFCFLSHPPPLLKACGWLPARWIDRTESRRGLLRSVCPFSVTLEPALSRAKGRHCTPCPSYASSGCHVPRYYVAEWGHVPFGPACQPV